MKSILEFKNKSNLSDNDRVKCAGLDSPSMKLLHRGSSELGPAVQSRDDDCWRFAIREATAGRRVAGLNSRQNRQMGSQAGLPVSAAAAQQVNGICP